MKPTDFAKRLAGFLTVYLPGQRNVSSNTIRSYRDAFTLVLRFLRDARGIAPENVTLDMLDAPLVLAFLDHVERDRGCSARTRNQRLAALHSFFRYLQTEDPARILQAQRILAIPSRRYERRSVSYLPAEDVGAILAGPDRDHNRGRRDSVLLSVLYDTGARCQELIDLRVRDVRLDAPAHLRLTGKGRKQRLVPLMPSTVELLRGHLREHHLEDAERSDDPLFQGRHGRCLSRSGVRGIVARNAETARTKRPTLTDTLGPHTMRHSKAMHLLQAGVPLVVIRDILGHVDVKTTEVYARADLDMKRRALEKGAASPTAVPLPTATSWRNDTDLLGWLGQL
ncbi:MAG: site-specific integrase [Polyangiales bacterium]